MLQIGKKTILVVDDEKDVRIFLSAALEEAGFTVITAEDGFVAMEMVEKYRPDLISLDLVMPKKSGARLYHELVKDKRWSKIPVLIVTGHARDDLGRSDFRELTMSGPGVYLEKPVKPESYVAAVKQILGLETTESEEKASETARLQNELRDMIDDADPEMLKKLKDFLKQKA
jgi:DNA-binding response OmpR family regulator